MADIKQIKIGDITYDIKDSGAIQEPSSEGTSGQVLMSDGNGGRYWGSALSQNEKTLMLSLFKASTYDNSEMLDTYNALSALWGYDDSGETTTYYTVTNNLTNVTNSNSAGAVEGNSSYNATLTVSEDYDLESVTVKMGGTDVTSTVYDSSTNEISITSVTGDIVITATAKARIEARTVYYASDDSIVKAQGAMNTAGGIVLTTNVRYKIATLPYSDGMEIHTYTNNVTYYPPVLLYDGNNYTVPEYTTESDFYHTAVLTGLSNPTVYVNMLGTSAGVFDDAKFYYITA